MEKEALILEFENRCFFIILHLYLFGIFIDTNYGGKKTG